MFPTLPDRTDCFCGLVPIVEIQNWDPYHYIYRTSKMTGTHQEQLIDHLRVLLLFIELNILLYMIISRHRRQQNPAPAQPASPPHPPPRRRRKPQNPWIMPWILQREERGCYRTLLDELITTDIPGYRNFTRMEPPSQEVNHQLQEATGSQIETGSYFETFIHTGKLHFTAIPLEGWKNDHLQICLPGLQSHFERISTRIFDVSH